MTLSFVVISLKTWALPPFLAAVSCHLPRLAPHTSTSVSEKIMRLLS